MKPSEITREYIAGILCAMQVAGDDEASAAIEKFIVQLEAMLQQAAEDAFVSEVVQTEMLSLELEANPWIGAKQYKEDWIETWLCALQEEVARKEIQ